MMLNVAPLASLLLFFVVGALGRSLVQWRRYGTLGFALSPAQILGSLVLCALFLAQPIAAVIAPAALATIMFALPVIVRWCGVALVLIATLAMLFAQLDLGASWRIGIDRTTRPSGLVTSGYYRVCRNPIFGFMLLALVGMTLLVPTVISLALMLLAYVVTRWQVVHEEAWLAQTYGEAYREYAAKVGRFTPWSGRLAIA